MISRVAKFLYTGYVGLYILITLLPAWIAMMITPVKLSQKILRWWAKSIMWISFCPLTITGKEKLKQEKGNGLCL